MSLVLFCRPHCSDPWRVEEEKTKHQGAQLSTKRAQHSCQPYATCKQPDRILTLKHGANAKKTKTRCCICVVVRFLVCDWLVLRWTMLFRTTQPMGNLYIYIYTSVKLWLQTCCFLGPRVHTGANPSSCRCVACCMIFTSSFIFVWLLLKPQV